MEQQKYTGQFDPFFDAEKEKDILLYSLAYGIVEHLPSDIAIDACSELFASWSGDVLDVWSPACLEMIAEVVSNQLHDHWSVAMLIEVLPKPQHSYEEARKLLNVIVGESAELRSVA